MHKDRLLTDIERGPTSLLAMEEGLEKLLKYLGRDRIDMDNVELFLRQNNGGDILNAVSHKHRGKNVVQVACSNLAKNISKEENLAVLNKLITDKNLFYSNRTEECREAIHYAALSGHENILQVVIEAIKKANLAKINATTSDGDTALVLMMKKRPNKLRDSIQVLVDSGADIDVPNNDNCTAVLLACKKIDNYCNSKDSNNDENKKEMAKIIELLVNKNCDVDSHRLHDRTARNYIQNRKQVLGQIVLPERKGPESLEPKHHIFGLLKEGRQSDFLNHVELRNYVNQSDGTITLLQLACAKGYEKCVQKLLSLQAKVNSKTEKNDYPLEIAGRKGFVDIFTMVLNKTKIDASDVLLDISKNLYHKRDNKIDYEKCLEILLNHKSIKFNVNCQDVEGLSPLHCSTKIRKATASLKLLKAGALLSVLNNDGGMPIDDIDISTLEKYFDYCIHYKNTRLFNNPWVSDDEKKALKLIEINYRTLLPKNDDPETSSSHMEVIAKIANRSELTSALKHPFVSSFLFLKWHRIRWIHYINIMAYALFCFLLYIQIFSTYLSQGDGGLFIATLLLFFMSTVMVMREAMQFLSRPKYYLYDFENWMELILFGLTFVIILGYPSDLSKRKQLAAFAILLSAFELILSLGQLPQFSINVKMLKTVSGNFIKFILWHFILLLGFVLSFYILFSNVQRPEGQVDCGELDLFQNFTLGIVKSVVMLTGEFDASNIQFQLYPITSVLIFLAFVFMISMVVFNLLNGLAISDIQEIKQKAEIVANRSRLNYMLTLESVFVKFFRNTRFKYLHNYFFELIYTNSKFIEQGKVLVTGKGKFLEQQKTDAPQSKSRRWWNDVQLDATTFEKIRNLVDVIKIEESYCQDQVILKHLRDLEVRQKEILNDLKRILAVPKEKTSQN